MKQSHEESRTTIHEGTSPEPGGRKPPSVSRRTWLRLAGAGVLAGSAVVGSVGAGSSDHPNTIVFDGTGAPGKSTYEFGVSGSVHAGDGAGALEVNDTIDGTSVVGAVHRDEDAYSFSGHLVHLDVAGDATVSVSYGDESPIAADRLEIVTPADGSVDYTFTATDRIEKVLGDGDNAAETGNDAVTENADGTWTADGLTSDGYGDTYEFWGDATAFEPSEGSFTLLLNGEEVQPWELTGGEPPTHRLEIITPATGSVDYTFTATGEITKDLDNGDNSAETGNDAVTQNADGTWTVDGLTSDGYGDTYDFQGEATAFDPKEGSFSLRLDGTSVTPYELVGEEPPASTRVPMGGGAEYENTVSPSQADYTVSTRSGLESALSSAASGEVVYVDGGASIDLGQGSYTLPAGVTLASDRGLNGAPGGLIYTTTNEQYTVLDMNAGSRATGLRFRGPHPDSGPDQLVSVHSGFTARGNDVEVDNCEAWGFVEAAVFLLDGDGHVHHNHLHDNSAFGYGYGVSCHVGRPVIEYNYFDNNRHSVASGGEHDGYLCRFNHFGPETRKHVIDAHSPANGDYHVHNNVVEPVTRWEDGNPAAAIAGFDQAGGPFVVEDNWFFQDESQAFAFDRSTVTIRNNHYGEGASVTYSDVVPDYDGWRTNTS